MRGPPLCVVFCAFQAILARQPVSRLLALLPRPLSPAPRARNPPPFLFVAHHRLLAVKKKKEILTTEEKLISTAGSCRLDVARPRPTLLLFVRNTDINVYTDLPPSRFDARKEVFQFRFRVKTGRCLTQGRKGYFEIFAFNEMLRISTNIFRSAMIHGSGTSVVDLGASEKLLFFHSISSWG